MYAVTKHGLAYQVMASIANWCPALRSLGRNCFVSNRGSQVNVVGPLQNWLSFYYSLTDDQMDISLYTSIFWSLYSIHHSQLSYKCEIPLILFPWFWWLLCHELLAHEYSRPGMGMVFAWGPGVDVSNRLLNRVHSHGHYVKSYPVSQTETAHLSDNSSATKNWDRVLIHGVTAQSVGIWL